MSAAAIAVAVGCGAPPPMPNRDHPSAGKVKRSQPKHRQTTVKLDVGPVGPKLRPKSCAAPLGFVELQCVDDSIRIDMRYATAENFTGAPLPGYLPGVAWLSEDAAKALSKVQASLSADGFGLLVLDAYRPKRASAAMGAWARKTKRSDLLDDGYVAPRSNHNRGTTVDLTLVALENGKELDMGTAWDTFSQASHYASASGQAKVNRKRLRDAMVAQGFEPYAKEWWHFTRPGEPKLPARDVPYDE